MIAVLSLLLGLAAAQPAPAETGVENDPHAQVTEILSQPLFQRWKLRQERLHQDASDGGLLASMREVISSALRPLRDWLSSWLRGWRLPRFGGLGGGISMYGVLKVLAMLVLTALGIYLVVLLLRHARGGQAEEDARVLGREQLQRALEDGDALALGGAAWLTEADRLAEAGESRAVYRALYLALLSDLHRSGRIEFRRQRTNWTYVSRFRGPVDEQQQFANLTTLFDHVWYGRQSADLQDLGAVRARVQTLSAGGRP